MVTSNLAFKFDHETAQAAVKEVMGGSNMGPSYKLAALYGARLAIVSGGVPDAILSELDAEIDYWERHRDMETTAVEVAIGKEV